MKKRFERVASVLCAGLLLTSVSVVSVSAAEEEEIMLPSEYPWSFFQKKMAEMEQFRESASIRFASAAVGVFQGDEVLYTGYFGETDIENHVSANEESVYEWGSISKTLTWVSVMQLWEQGRIDLDRDVREYLPDGFFQHLSYDAPITMMHLMNHNAGWQETTRPIFQTEENAILPLGQALQEIEPAQINRPGEVVAYSNYGAAVAGYVVECITGQDYCAYVHEHIFEPLGMEHTALNPTHSDNAFVYAQRKKTKSYQFNMDYYTDLGYCLNYIPAYPAGAATGTLSDLMTYAQALVNEDAPLFQNKETQTLMFMGTDFYGDSDIPTCAHGFWCNEYAVRTYGHSGATSSGQANMLFDLTSKTGLVVMTNEPNGNWFLQYLPIFVFGELLPDQYGSEASEPVELNGYYLISRSTYHGMMKFLPYLSAMKLNHLGDFEKIGNGLYQLKTRGEMVEEQAILFGTKTYSDGSYGIEQPSVELKKDRFYLIKLCLFTVYVLLAVATIYLLRIRHKLKKAGRWTAYAGSNVMITGQMARLVSVIALVSSCVVFLNHQGGMPITVGAVIGIVQMLCVVLCIAAALISVIIMLTKKPKRTAAARYLLDAAGNVLTVSAIVFFEMYCFWG